MILKRGLKRGPGVHLGAMALWLASVAGLVAGSQNDSQPPPCDPVWAVLFTPRTPRLGHYRACVDSRSLTDLAPRDATVEAVEALDAFGVAGAYDRGLLARVYGGTRARVARSWTRGPRGLESLTFIAPYPDGSLTRLERGTLVIHWFCDCGL